MRILPVVLVLLVMLPGKAFPADSPSPSLASLTADGYQVKAMSTIGPVMLFLQKDKEPKAYFCATKTPLGLDSAKYGELVGSAACTEVKAP